MEPRLPRPSNPDPAGKSRDRQRLERASPPYVPDAGRMASPHAPATASRPAWRCTAGGGGRGSIFSRTLLSTTAEANAGFEPTLATALKKAQCQNPATKDVECLPRTVASASSPDTGNRLQGRRRILGPVKRGAQWLPCSLRCFPSHRGGIPPPTPAGIGFAGGIFRHGLRAVGALGVPTAHGILASVGSGPRDHGVQDEPRTRGDRALPETPT